MKLNPMPKVFTSLNQRTGKQGEDIAVQFLMKQSYKILERNYTQKWGELDIVAEKEEKIYFVEVKSVARETLEEVARETNTHRPEDNMHAWKLKRLSRTIQTYILSNKIKDTVEWQFDLIVVYMGLRDRLARVRVVRDIIL